MLHINELKFKSIRISAKGQITIPSEIQKEMGIKKGDELLLIRKGKKILLEKSENFAEKLDNEFEDLIYFSEKSLKSIWSNKNDEIWNYYVK